MKILYNGIVRDMTDEEEAEYLHYMQMDEASPRDYENALSDLGVRFGD